MPDISGVLTNDDPTTIHIRLRWVRKHLGVSDTMLVRLGFSLVGRPMWSWCGGSLDKEGAKRIAEHFKQFVGEAVSRALCDHQAERALISNSGVAWERSSGAEWVLRSPINGCCWLEWAESIKAKKSGKLELC